MTAEDSTPPPKKADPEAFAIRARPPRAVRFRRGIIVTLVAASSVSLVAVAWVALKPVSLQHAAASEDLSQPNRRSAAEALESLPASYADTPKLGPPLPGDLGRPILDHQRALADQRPTEDMGSADQAAAAERERRLAELTAARESAVLFQDRGGEGTSPTVAGTPNSSALSVTPNAPEPASSSLDPERDPNAQQHKAEFVAEIDHHPDVNPHLPVPPATPYLLSAGSVIPASLVTGLRSDLPGLVMAQVTERVYDSPTGQLLLIPQGARLIGSYDSVVAYGQRRALIVWQRLVMPDGISLKIDNVPATDAAGYAGIEDKVDFHTWQVLKGVALSTLLGVSSELALSGQSDLVQAIRMSTQDSAAGAGNQITQHNLAVQPTITIRPGTPVRLVVHKDLVFARAVSS